MIFKIAVMVFLGVMTVCDLKSRSVPFWPVILFAVLMAVLHLVLRDYRIWEVLAGVLPGLFLFLLAVLLPSSIGTGDGLVIAAGGAGIGLAAEFASLLTALTLCAGYSAVLLARKKASKKDCLPFIPFLAAGHALVLALSVIGA